MGTQLTPGVDDQSAIMACIGHVCIQWALLENNILAVLCTCQNVSTEEAAILFGGLDMKPRLGMAINLATHHKWHPSLIKRLRSLRTAIDKAKLVDRRNIIVHGVHKASDKAQTFTLYSPRRNGSAQHEDWTILEAHALGVEIHAAGLEAWAIFEDYGKWKFGDHPPENSQSQIVTTPPGLLARIKQHFRPRFNHKGRWG